MTYTPLTKEEIENLRKKHLPEYAQSDRGYTALVGAFFGRFLLYVWLLALTIFFASRLFIQTLRHRLLFMPINSASSVEQVQSILNAGEEYKKNVPKHICLAILEEKLNFEDISRMAVWCHALGAKYISFFDPLGTLMGSSKVLEEELKKKFFECRIPKDEMVFLQPGEKFNSLNVDNDATVARILDVKDGQKKAGDVISSILNDAISNKENPLSNVNEFSVLDIEARLIAAGENFPDPECVICFSPVDATLGLLPWQLNHSELILVPSHHGILPSQFLQAFERYCKVEKRFGK